MDWLVRSRAHLERVCADFAVFYNVHRPHQAYGGRTLEEVHLGRQARQGIEAGSRSSRAPSLVAVLVAPGARRGGRLGTTVFDSTMALCSFRRTADVCSLGARSRFRLWLVPIGEFRSIAWASQNEGNINLGSIQLLLVRVDISDSEASSARRSRRRVH